jgi:hypothetical protein
MPTETLDLLNKQFTPEFPIANVKAITTLAIAGQLAQGWEILGHGGYVTGWAGAYQAGAFGNAASGDSAAAGEFRSACCEAIETLSGSPPELEAAEGIDITSVLAILLPIILNIIKKRIER